MQPRKEQRLDEILKLPYEKQETAVKDLDFLTVSFFINHIQVKIEDIRSNIVKIENKATQKEVQYEQEKRAGLKACPTEYNAGYEHIMILKN